MEQNFQPCIVPPAFQTSRAQQTHILEIPGRPYIAYAHNNYVVIYDFGEGRYLKRVTCKSQVSALAVHPKGYYLAAGDINGRVEIFSLDNPELIGKFSLDFSKQITSLRYDFEGKRLLVGCDKVIVFDTETELKNELPCPSSYITNISLSSKRPFQACVTGYNGEVFFYSNQALQFKSSIDLKKQEEYALEVGDSWYVCGAEGRVRVFDKEFKQVEEVVAATQTCLQLQEFTLGETHYLSCGTNDCKIAVLKVLADGLLEPVCTHSFSSACYANSIVGLSYSEQAMQLVAVTLSGKLLALSHDRLVDQERLDDCVKFCISPALRSVQVFDGTALLLYNKKAYLPERRVLLSEKKYDQILSSDALFFDGRIGFTRTSSFTLKGDELIEQELEEPVKFTCTYDEAYYLASEKQMFKFADGQMQSLQTVPAGFSEITALCCHEGVFAVAMQPKDAQKNAQIFLCDGEFEFEAGNECFESINYLQIVDNLLFVGNVNMKFTAFELEALKGQGAQPKYSKLDKGSKIQGRVREIYKLNSKFVVYGDKGVCLWEVCGEELVLKGSESVSSPIIRIWNEQVYCEDGCILSLTVV